MLAPKKSTRPRSRPRKVEDEAKINSGSTRSIDGLNMSERAARDKKIDRAQLSAGRRKTLELMDSRLPGASKKNNEDKQGLLNLLDMLYPDKKAYGGKMKTVKKMKDGGATFSRRMNQSIDDQRAIDNKFSGILAPKGGAAEAEKQKIAVARKASADLKNVDRYGKDASKGRSFGQKTQPKQGEMKKVEKKKVEKKAYGGKMKTVKKMGSGGSTCRGMGAAKRGGKFVKG